MFENKQLFNEKLLEHLREKCGYDRIWCTVNEKTLYKWNASEIPWKTSSPNINQWYIINTILQYGKFYIIKNVNEPTQTC